MRRVYFTQGQEASTLRKLRKGATQLVTRKSMDWFPDRTTRLAERVLCAISPPRRQLADLPFLQHNVEVYDQRAVVHKIGHFDRSVLFVHGWSGSSADFNAFYDPVLTAGFNVLALDHVAHGAAPGRMANMFLFVRAIDQVLTDPQSNVRAVIAHSMGATAVINTVHTQHAAMPVVLISPLLPLFESLYESVDNFGISLTWVDQLIGVFENRYARSIDEIDPTVTIQRFSNPTLMIHDRQDRQVSLERNRQFFTPHLAASLHETEGLGHFKILGADNVVRSALGFLEQVT